MRYYIFALFLWTGAALAQNYPAYENTTVNDFAEVLSSAAEQRLAAQLDRLKRDDGVEMTVLTLRSQSDYAPDKTLEQFATGLFNEWGIGHAQRNDGVLVLVILEDRAMRIELGAAYARDWDNAATQVIDDHFLGAFADGDYPRGIREGTSAVITEIVRPFLAGEKAPRGGQSKEIWFASGVFALMFAVSGRKAIGDFMARFRTCQRCGQRGLRQERRTVMPATKFSSGQGIRRLRCRHCDYEAEFSFTISRLSSGGSSGGFGGGSSGGGGGSGRW